jgi:hypothetical protein
MFTKDVFKDEKAPAFALLTVALRKYGFDILDEEAELLRLQIERDYDIKLSDLQSDKLQAAIIVLHTDHFEYDWRVFETICHLFNNAECHHDVLDPLEAEEIPVALAEVAMIKSSIEPKEDLDYGDEVRAYAGHIFYEYGLHKAPKIFPTAIMPKSVECNDKEKNAALSELFDAHANYILEYVERIS